MNDEQSPLDWTKANHYLLEIKEMITYSQTQDFPNPYYVLLYDYLSQRYDAGERSQELYDAIMEMD